MTALEIDAAILADLFQQAEEALPVECCGTLVGSFGGGSTMVERVLPAINIAYDSSHRFEIAPEVLLRIHVRARDEHMRVVGYYHSHPYGVAVPSAADRAAAWPGVSHLILAVDGQRERDARCWRLLGADGFREEQIALRTRNPQSSGGGQRWG